MDHKALLLAVYDALLDLLAKLEDLSPEDASNLGYDTPLGDDPGGLGVSSLKALIPNFNNDAELKRLGLSLTGRESFAKVKTIGDLAIFLTNSIENQKLAV